MFDQTNWMFLIQYLWHIVVGQQTFMPRFTLSCSVTFVKAAIVLSSILASCSRIRCPLSWGPVYLSTFPSKYAAWTVRQNRPIASVGGEEMTSGGLGGGYYVSISKFVNREKLMAKDWSSIAHTPISQSLSSIGSTLVFLGSSIKRARSGQPTFKYLHQRQHTFTWKSSTALNTIPI